MAIKKKHLKQLKKNKLRREAEKAKNEPEIDFDTSAYVVYNRLEMTYPCLSFDILKDDLGSDSERVRKFPLSLTMIAGAQTPAHVENNYIYVMKVDNIKTLKQEDNNLKDDDDEESEEDDVDDAKNLPNLNSIKVPHKGCVNRLRVLKLSGRNLTATWSDKGKVHIWDLTSTVHALSDQKSINTYLARKVDPKPVFTFGGHLSEGYAIDWAPHRSGSLATGDCKKNIHIWTMKNQADWFVDQQPLVGHEDSVEDIKWSPKEADVLASCSVDKSINLWDLRLPITSRCTKSLKNSHSSDVNVIDWNKNNNNLLVSGGDDGVVKIWDIRHMKDVNDDTTLDVANFNYHKKPITTVEWDPNDETVIAIGSDDDKLTLWDLAVEKDDEQDLKMEVEQESGDEDKEDTDEEETDDEKEESEDEGVEYDLKKVPEQMLFLHQGQTEIKELHWHPQLKGLLISTAANGINIFKTISA